MPRTSCPSKEAVFLAFLKHSLDAKPKEALFIYKIAHIAKERENCLFL